MKSLVTLSKQDNGRSILKCYPYNPHKLRKYYIENGEVETGTV